MEGSRRKKLRGSASRDPDLLSVRPDLLWTRAACLWLPLLQTQPPTHNEEGGRCVVGDKAAV